MKSMDLSQWKKLFASTQQATGFTPAQIRKNSGQPMMPERIEENAYELEAKKLEAIKQQSSKGFQIFDINPNNIEREDAFCAYPPDVMTTMIGTESVNSISAAGAGDLYYDNSTGVFSNGAPVILPYWRSIYIPVAGNFLKVEYLPARIGTDTGDFNTNKNSNQRIQNSTEPQNTTEKDFYDFYAPFSPTYFNANKVASDRIIFLDFNEPTDKPIIIKHGERVKNYFNGVWLTFKQDSPRIRVTIGFNSEISTVDDRPQNLHLWRGHGLMNDSFINPVPFCISNFEVADTFGLQTTGPVIEHCIFANPTARSTWEQNGLSVFWITNFLCDYLFASTDNLVSGVRFILYVKSLGTVASKFVTGSVKIKKLLDRTVIKQSQPGSVGMPNFIGEPLRVTLRRETGLFLRIIPQYGSGSSAQWTNYFTLEGYSMGPIQNYLLSAESVPRNPFVTRYKLGENPYPIDLDDLYSPLN